MKHIINMVLAFIALLVLVAVQVFVINEMFQLKKGEFDKTYEEEVFYALEQFNYEKSQSPFSSILLSLNNYADTTLLKYPVFEFEDSLVKLEVANEVKSVMAENDSISVFLASYLGNKKLETDFQSGFQIRKFSLIHFNDRYNIMDGNVGGFLVNSSSIFIQTITAEYNFYHIEFDFYIDFTHKKKVIIREMRVALLLVFGTISIVLIVYLLTLRNLLRQKKLSELKSDFINNMTHELKTPLSTISVASSGLSITKGGGNKKLEDLAGVIKKQIKLLNKMIDQILDISMLERAGFVISKNTFELVAFFEEVIGSYKLKNKDKELNIYFVHQIKGSHFVMLDKFQLNRVLLNLLSNSVKYCNEVPEIKINIEKDDNQLVIRFKDNGIGIPQKEQKHVFNKFYRLETAREVGVKGLGLGLYFVKKIVEAHNGYIEVESTPGKGSTFVITIPLEG